MDLHGVVAKTEIRKVTSDVYICSAKAVSEAASLENNKPNRLADGLFTFRLA